jgi:glycosyltransferase involved in cell wall biosynthesis
VAAGSQGATALQRVGQRRAPKLLLVATGIDRRGAENHVLSLAGGCVARGWEVAVAYWGGSGELAPEFAAANVNVHRIGFRGKLNPLNVLPFVRLIAAIRPDVVHTHLPLAELYGNLSATLRGVPVVVSTKHSDHAIFRRPLVRLGHTLISALDDAVIAVSEYMARFVRSVGLWPGTPLLTIYNGVDLAAVDRAGDQAADGVLRSTLTMPGERLIGAAGRLEPEKGFDILVSAMPRILADAPNTRLAIAGEGSCRIELERQIEWLGLGRKVRLLGSRADLLALMHAFDMFVLPSRAEPFGLVLLESMAAHRAVVATRVGGVLEIVRPGETGDVVTPGDPLDLAAKVLALLAEPVRAERYGLAGRRRVEQAFSLERMLGATDGLYRGLLERRTVGAERVTPC